MSSERATFDPLRAYVLDWKQLKRLSLTLTRRSDREVRVVPLADAINGVLKDRWTFSERFLLSDPKVTIQGAESSVEGPTLALSLLRAFAHADDCVREALGGGRWHHFSRRLSDVPPPVDYHEFFVTYGSEVRGTVLVSDEWSDDVRLASVVVPADALDDWDLERAILARQRFETGCELGRLMAINRRIEMLDGLGVRPALDTLDLQDQILAGRRTAEIVRQLRRITWLLVAILAIAIWFAWRTA